MHAHSRKLIRLCGACALTGAALTGTAALAGGQPAPSLTALAAHLALGPSVLGRDARVSVTVRDRGATVPLGRLAVGAELPGGVAYVPHSVTLRSGDRVLAVPAPHIVLQGGGATELVWSGLPAGHEGVVLDFTVHPTGRAGEVWSSFVAVSEAEAPVGARAVAAAGPQAAELQGVATARAVAHVVPFAVSTSRRAGVETVAVTGNPRQATTGVVVRAYLPAGVGVGHCPPAVRCEAPVVSHATLPTLPQRPKVPVLDAPAAPTLLPATAIPPASIPPASTPSTSTPSTSIPPPTPPLPSTVQTVSITQPVPTAPVPTAPVPTTAVPTTQAHPNAGRLQPFTVLTWRLGTVRAGARVTKRFAVYAEDGSGPRGSWLVTATGRPAAGQAHDAPAVTLTVEHLASWSAARPGHKSGSPQRPSTPPSTTPDPFGSGGNGSSSGSGSSSTTTPSGSSGTPTTTTTTATAAATTAATPTTSTTKATSGALTATSLPYTGADAQLELEIAMAALLLGAGVVATSRPGHRPRLAMVTPGAAPVPLPRSPAGVAPGAGPMSVLPPANLARAAGAGVLVSEPEGWETAESAAEARFDRPLEELLAPIFVTPPAGVGMGDHQPRHFAGSRR